MSTNPPDRVPYTGLWKVCIFEDERFVRSDKEFISYFEAKRFAEQLNATLNIKSNAARK
ncbi:MAG: hypothetical protein H0U18_03135 [Pyrinomonadaceae bacterium]|jgi:hypothetical protein|nr:hypothetical protein [Pyrinomonadaceae bacterium]